MKIGATFFFCSDFDENIFVYVTDDSNKKKIYVKKCFDKIFLSDISFIFIESSKTYAAPSLNEI